MKKGSESLLLVLTCACAFFAAQYLGYLRHEERALDVLQAARQRPRTSGFRLAWRLLSPLQLDELVRSVRREALKSDAPNLRTEVLRKLRLAALAASESEVQLHLMHAVELCQVEGCTLPDLNQVACTLAEQRPQFKSLLENCATRENAKTEDAFNRE